MKETSKEIARAILSYLVEHPQSQDTADGIERWWLLKKYVASGGNLVRQALDSLVRDRFVLCSKREDQHEHYRLNPEKIDEARKLVEKWISDTAEDRSNV